MKMQCKYFELMNDVNNSLILRTSEQSTDLIINNINIFNFFNISYKIQNIKF